MKLATLFRRLAGPAEGAGIATAPVSISRTHVGRVRSINEDRLFDCAERGLWAVADGMGGHAAGDAAATAVVGGLQTLTQQAGTITEGGIRAALVAVSTAIYESRRDRARASGATVVAAHVEGLSATILWAGDSRAYLYRAGRLDPVSRDHSVVQEMIDAGTLAPNRARSHPHAHVVTRALGVAAHVEIEGVQVALQPGDRLLLCSDGLSGAIPEAMIAPRLRYPLGAAGDALIEAALAAGGHDNISLVLVDVPG